MRVIIDEETFDALEARGYEVVLSDGQREVRVVRGMTVEEVPAVDPTPEAPPREPKPMLDLSEAVLVERDGLFVYEWPEGTPAVDFDVVEAIREAREQRSSDMVR